ncbi:DUF362 domain-containing protein [Desulfogranum mediterraneum]|uniref:DUF362 domain-containing protein n=1 Tax=Desulfogranum mediterraneum TaxID=160661 RepID=UPI000425D941|nr:DUF362 domain-containing protein [Desulfogranum mediterraneum]
MAEEKSSVGLLACADYDSSGLALGVDQLLTAVLARSSWHSCHVLVKPNLISASRALACTEPAVLAAVCGWFIDRGARVEVGDSPAFGTAGNVLDRIGALAPLQRLGVGVREFDQAEQLVLPGGGKVGLAAAARECDLLVNLPRLKAHAQTRLTMAVKNLFGCVVGFRKPWWHMVHGGEAGSFLERIVELPAVLPPGVALLDGIRAMHVTGPVHGRPFQLGLLGCARNGVALDTALLKVLDVAPSSCPLWGAARRLGRAGVELEEISWLFQRPEELAVRGFCLPDELMPIRFNPFRFLKNSLRRLLLNSRP